MSMAVTDDVESLAGRAVGGALDAWAVLGVRVVRRLWIPCFILGVVWVVLQGEVETASDLHLSSVPEILAALLSPLVGIVLALGLRFLSTALGVLAAVPVARRDQRPTRRWWGAAVVHVVSVAIALRWLRATTAARDVALLRLPPRPGAMMLLVDRVQTALIPLTLVLGVALIAVNPQA